MANNILRPDEGANDERIYPSGYTQTSNGGTAMARSLLRQLEQIRWSANYTDDVSNIYTADVAEPNVSGTGSLEGDLNNVRSLMKEMKGSTDWYSDLGNYFDPTDTDGSNTENKDLNITSLKNNTLDSKTILIAVAEDNSGAGFTVTATSSGVLTTSGSITTDYATDADRRGLPIWESAAGAYFDEGGDNNTCRVDVLDVDVDGEFDDGTDIIWAKMYDGADNGGTGMGADVYFQFYKGSPGTECDLTGTGVTSVKFIYPKRKLLSEMAEHEWLRTDFVSSWEGDVELIEDLTNLWNYTGAADGETAPSWDQTGSHYLMDGSPTDLEAAINDINVGVGDRDYTTGGDYSLTDGETVTSSLEALNLDVKTNADDIATNTAAIAASSADKYIETLSADLGANVDHDLPYSQTYTPCTTSGQEGKNMDVLVNGQLLCADTGAAGVNADRDYAELDTNTIKFRFALYENTNVTYIIRS